MADKAKTPILIVLVLIILVSLSVAGATFNLLQKERTQNLVLQENLEEIRTTQKIAEAKLEESKKMIAGLESKLQEAQAQISNLTTGLDQERATKDQALSQIEQLRQDLETQKGLRLELENKLGQAQSEMAKFQAQLTDLEARKSDLETKVKELEAKTQDIELGKIVVSPEATAIVGGDAAAAPQESQAKEAAVASSLEGKILVINRDYNFAVINLGSKDSVGIGDTFSIYHSNKYITDIKIEKIHDSMSAGSFVSAQMKDKVSEGDKVLRKSK